MQELVRSLEDITGEAVVIYNRMEKDYRRWGELMVEAKKLVPHGQWASYLEKNFPMFGRRQAYRYMELAKDETKTLVQITHPTLKSNVSHETHLSYSIGPVPETDAQRRTFERKVNVLVKEKLKEFKHRGGHMRLRISEFLTVKDSIGRDLQEAVDNIDQFESEEELNHLREMRVACHELAVRAAEFAHKLEQVLGKKEITL